MKFYSKSNLPPKKNLWFDLAHHKLLSTSHAVFPNFQWQSAFLASKYRLFWQFQMLNSRKELNNCLSG